MARWEDEVRALAARGELEAAQERLTAEVSTRRLMSGVHRGWGLLALEVGLTQEALRELHLALRDDPDDMEALRELILLYQDLDEPKRVEELAGRLARLGEQVAPEALASQWAAAGASEAEAEAPAEDGAWMAVGDVELVRMLHRFGGREGVHARMWGRGEEVGWSPVKRPLTVEVLRAHVQGSVTVGVYPIRLDGTVTFLCLDLDLNKRARERARGDGEETARLRGVLHQAGVEVAAALEARGLPGVLEESGYKGRHVWGFLAKPLPADLVHRLGQALARVLPLPPEVQVEVFPRQAGLQPGQLGNLIKLPLGVHRRTGRRAMLLESSGEVSVDPWDLLRGAPLWSREDVLEALEALRGEGATGGEAAAAVGGREAGGGVEPWPAPAAFTSADLETHPEVGVVLRGCGVLRELASRAQSLRRLTHDEQVVLAHALGHLPSGVLAVNYLLARCPEVPRERALKSPLQGSPISCPKIRRRVSEVSARVGCHCAFPSSPERYPTPLLHVEEARARGEVRATGEGLNRGGEVQRGVEEVARAWSLLQEQVARLGEELEATRAALVEGLQGRAGGRLEGAGGAWVLEGEGVRWVPTAPEEA